MKHFLSGFATCAVICSLMFVGSSAIAGSPIKLFIDGEIIQCDVPPQIINGRVMVPARFVAEPLGARVEWDERSRTVIILSPNYKLPGEEIMSQQTNSLSQAKKELYALVERCENVLEASADVISINSSHQDYQNQIEEITNLKKEFSEWNAPVEYQSLQNLCVDSLGKARDVLLRVQRALDSRNITELYKAQESLYEFQQITSEIGAEINSLKQKGYL